MSTFPSPNWQGKYLSWRMGKIVSGNLFGWNAIDASYQNIYADASILEIIKTLVMRCHIHKSRPSNGIWIEYLLLLLYISLIHMWRMERNGLTRYLCCNCHDVGVLKLVTYMRGLFNHYVITENGMWISNHTSHYLLNVIIHSCHNFKIGCTKPPLTLRQEWINTSRCLTWMQLRIHAMVSMQV